MALLDTTLRQFAGYLFTHHPDVVADVDVGREPLEGIQDLARRAARYRTAPATGAALTPHRNIQDHPITSTALLLKDWG